MSNVNVFSGLSWGDLSRYKVRNDAVVREKRGAELDQRIMKLIEKEKTVEWARKAVDFCDRETAQNKDVFGISKEAFRLADIKKEALSIIQKENDRIAADKAEYASTTDAAILALVNAKRSENWCQKVQELNADVKQKMPKDVRAMLKNLSQLQKLVPEAELLIEAGQIDSRIRDLTDSTNKNVFWLRDVDALNKSVTAKIRPLLKETKLYENLQKEYVRVERYPVYSLYEECLKQIESGKCYQEQVRDDFDTLDGRLKEHKFAMKEYINDFDSRWAKAKSLVQAEKKRLLDEAMLAQKRREEAAAAAAAAEKAAQRKKKTRDALMSMLGCLLGYVIFSLVMYFGFQWAMALNNKFYTLFITAACSLLLIHVSRDNYYSPYSAGSIVGQIILYIEVILFSRILGYGIFNIVVCCATVAGVTNGCVRLFEIVKRSFRFFQAFASVLSVIFLIFGLEFWLSDLVKQNFWHALWVVPVLVIIMMTLCTLSTAEGKDTDETMLPVGFGLAFSVAVLIRSIGVVCAITGFSFGMFFFVVLQIAAAVLGGAAGIAITVGLSSLIYNRT